MCVCVSFNTLLKAKILNCQILTGSPTLEAQRPGGGGVLN